MMLGLAMSRGKVHRPVHNVEAPVKRRKTSSTIGIVIDTPTVLQGPGLRRRLKSQQQPRSSGAGLASETAAEHRRRHPTPQPSCPRCMYMRSRHEWELSWGCHTTRSGGGRVTRTVWLAERPAKFGGQWSLGCLFCSAYTRSRAPLSRGRKAKGSPRAIRGARGIAGAWSSFDVRALSQVASRGVRQHAETLTHRLATQAYFAPQLAKAAIVGNAGALYDSDVQLFRGGVPQVADWLRAWRACRSPVSFSTAEQIGATFDFIHSKRLPVATSRKAFRSMVRVMAFVLRARKLRALRAASSVCLSLDDKGAYRLVRFKCDQPSPAGAGGSTTWIGSTAGVLGVMRRGGVAVIQDVRRRLG